MAFWKYARKTTVYLALSKVLHLAANTKGVTVHGLCFIFRDEISDTNVCLRDVAERALAYAIGNKVEAAYRRSDLLEQRDPLMET
ncbi:hypothetical protein HK15_00995 [Acetobacter orientalis]|uniref:Uncharacterized protein n=1 Tax=Acetobacter orientalis TaxID=146474 RepID=A0A252B0N6_9PROT|nr:hypothetical protein HK15_00995 [Acetobacter orientalis]